MNKLKGSGIARLLVRATLGECGFSQVAEFTVSHLATLWSGNFRPRDDTRRAVIFGYLRARGAILH